MTYNHDELVAVLDKMPTFPQSVTRIIELTSDINCLPRELVKVIENDPILTMKLLKIVNSAYFGLSREVTSIQESVIYIGINTIKNIAVSMAAVGALPQKNAAGFDADKFWLHSLTMSTIARLMAKRRQVPRNEEANYFVAGLLHNIGEVVCAHFMEDDYQAAQAQAEEQSISIIQAETETFGVSRYEIGALLAEHWKLPPNLVESIRHHDTLLTEDSSDLDKTVYIAHIVSAQLQEANELWDSTPLPEQLQDWLGMPLESVPDTLDNLDKEVDKARLLINLSA